MKHRLVVEWDDAIYLEAIDGLRGKLTRKAYIETLIEKDRDAQPPQDVAPAPGHSNDADHHGVDRQPSSQRGTQ